MALISVWLPASLFGGLLQAWRTALQQRLRTELSVSAAGLVRYLYGLPVALILAATWLTIVDLPITPQSADFLGYSFLAAVSQMIGTILLIMSFGHRGFVVGTAFSKTEAIQAAIVTAVFFGERLPLLAWVAVGVGMAGVLILAMSGQGRSTRNFIGSIRQPAALCGLGAGSMFAFTAIAIKFATAQVQNLDIVGSALVTLVVILAIQTSLHLGWMLLRDRSTIPSVFRSYRTSTQIGLLSALGSACWCIGFASAPAALVRIVGQVEVVFTIAFARFYLKDTIRRLEVAGLLLVVLGVILALCSVYQGSVISAKSIFLN